MQYRMAPHRVQTHISYRIPHYRVPTAQAASPTPGEVFYARQIRANLLLIARIPSAIFCSVLGRGCFQPFA